MRIQHVVQTAKGWPDATAEDRDEGARLFDVVEEHIRWRLWHGQVQRALDLDAAQAVGQHRAEDVHHLPIAVGNRVQLLAHAP